MLKVARGMVHKYIVSTQGRPRPPNRIDTHGGHILEIDPRDVRHTTLQVALINHKSIGEKTLEGKRKTSPLLRMTRLMMS